MKNNYVSNLLEYRYAVNTYITVLTESGYFSEAATDKQRKKLLSESVKLTEDICSFKKKFPEELKSKRQELNEQSIPQILKAIFGGAKAAEAGKAAAEASKTAREAAPLPPLGKSAQGVLKDTTAGKPGLGLVPEVSVKVPETVSPVALSRQRISENELNQLRGYVMRQYSDALAETMKSGAGQFKNAEELHKAVMKKVSESGPLFKLPQEELGKIINTEALMPMSKSAFEGKGFLPGVEPARYKRTADDIRMGLKASDLRLQKIMQLEKAQAEYEQLNQVVSAMKNKGMEAEISPKVFGRLKDLESNLTKLEQDIAILGAETKYAEPEVPKLPSTETERAVSGIESTEAKAAELKGSLEAKRRARLSDEERSLEDKLRETNPKAEVIPDRRRLGTDKGTQSVGKEVAPKVTELETGESKGGLNTPASVEPESPRIVPSAQPTVTPGTVETPSIPSVPAEVGKPPEIVSEPTVPAKARTATPETPTLGGAPGAKPAGSKATRKPAQAQPTVTPEVPQAAEPAPAPQVVPAPTVPAKGSRVKPSSQPAALPNVSGQIAPSKRPAPAPQPTVTPEPQKQPQGQPEGQPQGKPQNKNKTDTEEQVTPETKTQPETQGPKPPAPPTTTVLDKVVPAGLAIAGVVGKLFGEEKPKIGGGTKYPSPAGSEPSGAAEDIDVHFSRGKLGSGAITGVYRIV